MYVYRENTNIDGSIVCLLLSAELADSGGSREKRTKCTEMHLKTPVAFTLHHVMTYRIRSPSVASLLLWIFFQI